MPSANIFCAIALAASTVMAASGQTVSVVATFDGADGQQPNSITQGMDGNFYGTTSFGGTYGEGTVFAVSPTGTLTSLYSFCAQISANCPDGSVPEGAPLVQRADGSFYGTTGTGGGSSNAGTIFKITPTGDLTTIYDFAGFPTDGSNPQGLILASDGSFYGVTYQGGANCESCGTFFKITSSGAVTVLYNFCSLQNCSDGSNPVGVIQASNGNFYGATAYGGSSMSCGTIFEITPGGQLTTLHNFNQLDGCHPAGTVIRGRDGGFYGTAGGGAHGAGVAFRMNTAGQFTDFYSFCSRSNCADGYIPNAPLLQASDGNFYGTTVFGGSAARNAGTVFRISRSGQLTTLYSFCQEKACPEGGKPTGSLIQANDGNIYGVNSQGGSGGRAGSGTVFRLTLAPAATSHSTQD